MPGGELRYFFKIKTHRHAEITLKLAQSQVHLKSGQVNLFTEIPGQERERKKWTVNAEQS